MTVVVYALAVAHTLGAGTDASTPWMRIWLFATAPVIAVLFVARLVGARRKGQGAKKAERPAPKPHGDGRRATTCPDMHVGAQPAISEDPA